MSELAQLDPAASVLKSTRLAAARRHAMLTAREIAVLEAVAGGESNREIADRLRIKEQTVKNHVSVVIQKLHVRNRVQLAVVVALEMPELLKTPQ